MEDNKKNGKKQRFLRRVNTIVHRNEIVTKRYDDTNRNPIKKYAKNIVQGQGKVKGRNVHQKK